MRRILTILFAVLFIAPGLSARSKSDWANVEKLKPGSTVLIVLSSGEELRGRLDGADDARLWLTKMDRRNIRGGSRQSVDRASVRKIVRFRQPRLPDAGKWMFASTLAGGAIGVVSGAMIVSREAVWVAIPAGALAALVLFTVNRSFMPSVDASEAVSEAPANDKKLQQKKKRR